MIITLHDVSSLEPIKVLTEHLIMFKRAEPMSFTRVTLTHGNELAVTESVLAIETMLTPEPE